MTKDTGASSSEDRAGGLRPEPLAASQPQALIPSAWDVADSLENALLVAANTRGFGDDMEVWSSLAWSAQQAIAALRASEPCPYCNNSGDIHTIDGEWRGECPYCVAKVGERVGG